MNTIRITCTGAAIMPLDDLVELQGDLKELSESGFDKLKALMLREGFAFPIVVARVKGKPAGIIDGHQRHRVVKRMVEEGATVVDAKGVAVQPVSLPVVFADCKDRKHAARLILAAISQFGKVCDDGLYEFAHTFEIDIPSLSDFDLPDFDTARFISGFAPVGQTPPPDTPEPPAKLADTQASIGEYRFDIAGERYLTWIEAIRLEVGFEDDKVIAELQRRLGL